ncbi:hypothetical protein QTP70_015641, partial [Hemibagrus guttatus]
GHFVDTPVYEQVYYPMNNPEHKHMLHPVHGFKIIQAPTETLPEPEALPTPVFPETQKEKAEDAQEQMRQKLRQEADSSPNTKGVALFVRDVDFSISEERLYKEFLPFGNIISFKLIMENGRSKGYAYVTYSTEAEAKTAMSELNGKILGMKFLHIVLSKSKEELARQKNERLRTRTPWSYDKDSQRVWLQRH